jgi:branched-chain amino acid transport system substrate-binding protein
MRRWAAPVLLPVLVALGCAGDGGTPITIGAAGSWHSAYGAPVLRGIELAVDEINANGGVRGRPLRLVSRDDSGTGPGAVAAAQALAAENDIVAVVGHINSVSTLAAAPIYDGRVPCVSPASTTPDLTGRSSWVFRIIPSDTSIARSLARFAEHHGHRRAAVLYQNDSYGRGLAGAFTRNFTGTVVADDPVDMTDGAASAEPYITDLRRLVPDVVFIAGDAPTALSIVREAHRQRLAADFLGGDALAATATDTVTSDGIYAATAFTVSDARPEAKRFVAAYQAKYGDLPEPYAALSYDATRLVAAAIAKAGPSRTAVRRYLAALDSTDAFIGITGPVRFHSGDPVEKPLFVARIQRGALVLADTSAP